ncbi:hypothetical protein LINPERPRIM_LOCUS16834 [Linum perenne]
MDEVVEAVEKTKQEWDEAYSTTQVHIKSIEEYGKSRDAGASQEKNSLPRLNGLAQDGLALLQSLEFKLDLLAPQLPTDDQVKSTQSLFESWKKQSHSLRLSLRNANLQAKANMRKAAQDEGVITFCSYITSQTVDFRENFFWEVEKNPQSAGEIFSTYSCSRRRHFTDIVSSSFFDVTSSNLAITQAIEYIQDESWDDICSRKHHRESQTYSAADGSVLVSVVGIFFFFCPLIFLYYSLFQEVERSANTLVTFDESTGVLKKAESEYKGHRSLLMRTRNLLSTMQRQDVIDRVIITVGFILFTCAVLYVVSKRIGILRLQRTVTAAIKAGMSGKGREAVEDGLKNLARTHKNADMQVQPPLKQPMHDEL